MIIKDSAFVAADYAVMSVQRGDGSSSFVYFAIVNRHKTKMCNIFINRDDAIRLRDYLSDIIEGREVEG